ncbi:MAG: DUF359 domain-containing protein [Candidatus Bathyarchaeia archaeon]
MGLLTRRLPEKMREELRKPFDELIRGEMLEAVKVVLSRLEAGGGSPMVIAVGDQSSKALLAAGGRAHVYIFDGQSCRKRTAQPKPPVEEIAKVTNPRGILTGEAREAVRKAVRCSFDTGIFVVGEEDLLALPAILYAPIGSLVLYGQPGEGLVVVKVDKRKKELVRNIIARMEVV